MVIHTQKEINNMPIKPKQRDLRDKNVTEPKDFDQEYDSLKGIINGGLDRDNLPVAGIEATKFRNNTFCSYYTKYFKLDEAVVGSPISERSTTGVYDDIPSQTYNTYAGGWYESSNSLIIPNIREGMCQIEFNFYYIMNKIALAGLATGTGSPAASIVKGDVGFCQVQLLHNGNVVADSAKMARNLQTIHICANIPVQTGNSEFSIAWRFNPRKLDTTNFPMNQGLFYLTGGNLMVINYYR
tara:strand:+ start:649 stop:1371 length:723 start_codon:yes stop_codon:yes gene_type:complete